jgi:hypothetical protein
MQGHQPTIHSPGWLGLADFSAGCHRLDRLPPSAMNLTVLWCGMRTLSGTALLSLSSISCRYAGQDGMMLPDELHFGGVFRDRINRPVDDEKLPIKAAEEDEEEANEV